MIENPYTNREKDKSDVKNKIKDKILINKLS